MVQAWVQLYCSDCEKEWETNVRELPEPRASFPCPDCGAERSMAEFMLTQRDLQTLKGLHQGPS